MPRSKKVRHGAASGYRFHTRREEPMCDACRKYRSAARAGQRKRRKDQLATIAQILVKSYSGKAPSKEHKADAIDIRRLVNKYGTEAQKEYIYGKNTSK